MGRKKKKKLGFLKSNHKTEAMSYSHMNNSVDNHDITTLVIEII